MCTCWSHINTYSSHDNNNDARSLSQSSEKWLLSVNSIRRSQIYWTGSNVYKNPDPGHDTTFLFYAELEMLHIQHMRTLHLYGICICHRHVWMSSRINIFSSRMKILTFGFFLHKRYNFAYLWKSMHYFYTDMTYF